MCGGQHGRLVTCKHRARCVSHYEHDGSRTILAASHDGKRLNSPNDVVVKSDRSVWFTDPSCDRNPTMGEYPRLYANMADLVRRKSMAPGHVADAFLMETRTIVEALHE